MLVGLAGAEAQRLGSRPCRYMPVAELVVARACRATDAAAAVLTVTSWRHDILRGAMANYEMSGD